MREKPKNVLRYRFFSLYNWFEPKINAKTEVTPIILNDACAKMLDRPNLNDRFFPMIK